MWAMGTGGRQWKTDKKTAGRYRWDYHDNTPPLPAFPLHPPSSTCDYLLQHLSLFFKKDFIYLFLEGKGRRKRRRETLVGCLLLSPTGDPARNPGMCPDGESNQQSFSPKASAQFTELYLPGLYCILIIK